ncbi:MAG: class I SAM-dependent methyltransferase [Acidobacteria bacterium]|nr:class I SAM-dependent methyltransferase [Acidobacteriota bacterium]
MSKPTPPSGAESLFGRPRSAVARALSRREAVPCPLCRVAPRPFGVDFQGLQLARCATCGLQFQSPRPVFDDLVQAVYGPAYHPPGEHVVDAVRRYQFERQMRWLEEVAAAGRRLLDVGCGSGAFLRFAQARGWEAEGTDVVLTPAAAATGARLWAGQLPSIAFDGRRYHAVRFNHVLEHTQDPLAELRAARALLEPGGVLHVGVPNLAGFTITLKSWQSRLRLKRKRWKHYGALHHLWFFTPRTLARLVEAAGFEVSGWETPVAGRPGRPAWLTAAVRCPLEACRAGGILDLYGR